MCVGGWWGSSACIVCVCLPASKHDPCLACVYSGGGVSSGTGGGGGRARAVGGGGGSGAQVPFFMQNTGKALEEKHQAELERIEAERAALEAEKVSRKTKTRVCGHPGCLCVGGGVWGALFPTAAQLCFRCARKILCSSTACAGHMPVVRVHCPRMHVALAEKEALTVVQAAELAAAARQRADTEVQCTCTMHMCNTVCSTRGQVGSMPKLCA